MTKATVKEIASHLGRSESRIRAILAMKGAPKYVEYPLNIQRGTRPGKYDLEAFVEFYNMTIKFNKGIRNRK